MSWRGRIGLGEGKGKGIPTPLEGRPAAEDRKVVVGLGAAILGFTLLLALVGCSNESEEERRAAEAANIEDADVLRYSLWFGTERYYRDHIYELRKTRLELRGIKEELKRFNDREEAKAAVAAYIGNEEE